MQSRKQSAPEGSYTSRLFNDPQLLRNKLLEEAQVRTLIAFLHMGAAAIFARAETVLCAFVGGQELIEAEDHDHVASEAADLLYFALVRCVRVMTRPEACMRSSMPARLWSLSMGPRNLSQMLFEA